jgi:hypothetical protein
MAVPPRREVARGGHGAVDHSYDAMQSIALYKPQIGLDIIHDHRI